MKKHSLKVVLKISKLSVPSKINRSRLITDAILSNAAVFPSPNPTIASIQSAIDELEIAWNEAADGGRTKTAIMHDKEDVLLKLMYDLAHYVEAIANGDESIAHLAGMATKKRPVFHTPDFEVMHTDDRGAVRLRVKPHTKSAYRWEYCKDPMGANPWIVAKTTVQSTTNWGDLDVGSTYWFRVFYVGYFGDVLAADPVSLVIC